jgi:DNA-binding transcriptional MerR regulator
MAEQSPPSTSHLSIGEVLSLVHDEFPDVTISKIRFLESQGLIDPERTPSGYRKFYDDDVELLRCILREQRENYLPLRVIKDRLDSGEIDPTNEHPRPVGIKNVPEHTDDETSASTNTSATSAAEPTASSDGHDAPEGNDGGDHRSSSSVRADHPSAWATGAASSAASFFAPAESEGANGASTARVRDTESPRSPADASPSLPVPPGGLDAAEVCALTGLSAGQLDDLVSFGVVGSTEGGARFDDRALEIATIAKRMLESGLDARHLRGWRVAADREAGLYEQLIQPLLRQRNPEAQEQALGNLRDLERLGGELHAALMRDALRRHLDS